MLKYFFYLFLFIFILNIASSNAQDLESGGTNSWILHTPDDGRTRMYVAPKINGDWDWGSSIQYHNNGNLVLSSGKLGVGTTSPLMKLHISAEDGDGIVIGKPNDPMGYDGGSYYIKFYGYRDVRHNAISAKISAERVNVCCDWLSQGTDLVFYTSHNLTDSDADNSLERLRITSTGLVGIGTTSPNYKLDVAGTIHTQEVKVDMNGWSDFVLHPTYNLRPLQEVNTYIQQNGHLPEIPTAKEVEENGISLGEMNAKLLQKIEELTLYTIEQEKKIKELEEQNKRIDRLESIINEFSNKY